MICYSLWMIIYLFTLELFRLDIIWKFDILWFLYLKKFASIVIVLAKYFYCIYL